MGIRINNNVVSLTAQNRLSQTSKKLNSTLERLSTGLRINGGKDDVVGLLKSENLRSQIRGITVAEQNLSNGSNLLNTAEGSLSQLTEVAQALREKLVQAADSTISTADRANITTAVSDLLSEYGRLAAASNFDGVKLLDGNFNAKSFQVGPNGTDTLSVTIADSRSAQIGQVAVLTSNNIVTSVAGSAVSFTNAGALTIGGISISGLTTDSVSSAEASESALAYVNAINSFSGQSGVSAQVLSNVYTVTYSGSTALTSSQTISINGVSLSAAAFAADDSGAGGLSTAINNISSQTGVTATIDTTNDTLTFTATDGRNIEVKVSGADSTVTNYVGVANVVSNATSTTLVRGKFKLFADSSFALVDAVTIIGSSATVSVSTSTALSQINAGSATNAATAIFTLDNVIRQLQTRRANVGSKSIRFDTALKELQSRKESFSQAESVIRDADIAKETADLTSFQILQQAGVSVLSRANGLPQVALTLLQG